MDIKQIVLDLCALSDEQEWFEFKENWFQPEALGEYVSALSNAAAFHYKKYAYLIWGVNDKTHEIVGTTIYRNLRDSKSMIIFNNIGEVKFVDMPYGIQRVFDKDISIDEGYYMRQSNISKYKYLVT